MIVHLGHESLRPTWSRSVVTIGAFDGIHLGHQELIRQTVRHAKERECPSILVTFDRHPAALLAPEKCPMAIASLSQDLRWIETMGCTAAVLLRFDHEMANRSPQAFFDEILVGSLRAEMVVVGHDFRFGKDREGSGEWLSSRIHTEIVPPLQIGGKRVSSGDIRASIAAGDVEQAALLLGRPYELEGIVVAGEKIGRTIGYPTINLATADRLAIPADGVYAGSCSTSKGVFAAAVGIGMRPVVDGKSRTIEAFLLEYPGDSLYGQTVRLEFLQRLRDEIAFDDLGALREQMGQDIKQTAEISRQQK